MVDLVETDFEQQFRELVRYAEKERLCMHPTAYRAPQPAAPTFWCNMWDGSVQPGQHMRYFSWVQNSGETEGCQMTITAFFGPGCLFEGIPEAVAARDASWPMLSSRMFNAPVGEVTEVEMGHRLPQGVVPGCYVLNLVLWELNNYNQPALIRDRMHLRFEVVE